MNTEICSKILTLSTCYKPVDGGVAQVVSTYSYIFPVFNHIATTKNGSALKKIFYFIWALIRLINFIAFIDVKIIHIHGASYTSFRRKRIFIQVAKILGMKVIYHVHGAEFKDFYKNNSKVVNSVFQQVDLVIALSSSWKIFFEEVIGHPRVRVVENIVGLPTISESQKDEIIHFLFLGELGYRKGIYDLLDAIHINRDFLKGKLRLHIGGNGEVKEVIQKIRQLDLEDLVIFEGWVSGDKKIQLLNLADVYVLPSYNEGLPISILEAMSYRLPIISTPVGGIPEVVIHEDNGLLVQPGDTKALGEAILKMVANKDFRKTAGESSYSKVQPYFPDNVSLRLEAVYRELLG